MSTPPGILSSFLSGFLHRLTLPRRNIYRFGAALLLFLIIMAGWALVGRFEAHFSACTNVLTDDQIEKITGLPVTRRSADHDEEGCSGRYESKHIEFLTVRMVHTEGERAWAAALEESKKSSGYEVEELDDLDDPAIALRRKSDGALMEVWVSRPAASGRIEVWFARTGARKKEISEAKVVAALKPNLAKVDAYLKELAAKSKR